MASPNITYAPARCQQCGDHFDRDVRTKRAFCSFECRFWSRVDIRSPKECWPWNGRTNAGGYGVNERVSGSRLAHRQAWEFVNKRPIPKGLFALHRCDFRPCCNEGHLFLGTKGDNNADMYDKGRDCHSKGTVARGPRGRLIPLPLNESRT